MKSKNKKISLQWELNFLISNLHQLPILGKRRKLNFS